MFDKKAKETKVKENSLSEKEKDKLVSVLDPGLAGWLADKLVHEVAPANFLEAEKNFRPVIGVLQAIASGGLLVVENPDNKDGKEE